MKTPAHFARAIGIAIAVSICAFPAVAHAEPNEVGAPPVPIPAPITDNPIRVDDTVLQANSVVTSGAYEDNATSWQRVMWRADGNTDLGDPEMLPAPSMSQISGYGNLISYTTANTVHTYDTESRTERSFPMPSTRDCRSNYILAMDDRYVAYSCYRLANPGGRGPFVSETVYVLDTTTGNSTYIDPSSGFDSIYEGSVDIHDGQLLISYYSQSSSWGSIGNLTDLYSIDPVTGSATLESSSKTHTISSLVRHGFVVANVGDQYTVRYGNDVWDLGDNTFVSTNGFNVQGWPQALDDGTTGFMIRFTNQETGEVEWYDMWAGVTNDNVDGRRLIRDNVIIDAGPRNVPTTPVDPYMTGEMTLSPTEIIGGTPVRGGTEAVWHGDGLTIHNAWYLNGVPIPGANSDTYTPLEIDAGLPLVFEQTVVSATGEVVAVVQTPPATIERILPELVTDPVVSNAVVNGEPTVGTYLFNYADEYRYAWYLDGAVISGATGTELVPTAAMVGHDLIFEVTAINPRGHKVALSEPVTVTAP